MAEAGYVERSDCSSLGGTPIDFGLLGGSPTLATVHQLFKFNVK